MNMKTQRIVWLDIAKGIAICLMVIGHTSIPSFLSNFIWAFHMPLFFIASGWTTNFEGCNLGSFIRKKTRGLLLPFMVYSILVIIIENSLGWKSFSELILHGWVAYALWFIPVLFFALICVKLTFLVSCRKLRMLIVGGQIMLGCSLNYWNIYLPWTLYTVPIASAFVFIGAYMKRYQRWIELLKSPVILLLLLITVGVSLFWRLDLCFNHILPIIPILVGSVSGSLMIFVLSARIEKRSNLFRLVFSSIGKETFVILAFSQIIIMLLNHYFVMQSLFKYIIMMIMLGMIVYLKNLVNKVFKTKIL